MCGAQPLVLLRAPARVICQWTFQVQCRVRPQAPCQAACQAACQAVPQVLKVIATAVTEGVRATTAMQRYAQVTGVARGQVEYQAEWPIGDDVANTPGVKTKVKREADAREHVMTDVRTRSVHGAHAHASINARQRVRGAIGTTAQVSAP